MENADGTQSAKTASVFGDTLGDLSSSFGHVLKDFKPWQRPLIAFFWAIFILLLGFVMLPVLVIRALRGPRADPVELLRAEVEGAWKEGSPEDAIEIARRVHVQLRDRIVAGGMWRRLIAPYGKMGMREFLTLSWYRYYWEMSLCAYDRAVETCDSVMVDPAKTRYVNEDWAIMKARALAKQSGNAVAIAYLSSLFSVDSELPKVAEFLGSLARAPEPS